MIPTATPDLRTRYLDLVRESLIGVVQEDPELAQRVDGGEVAFDPGRRAEGRDWPSQALSMIGAKRMLQLQRAAEFVIERGIPGARGILWEDVAHVVAGKEQKIRFARTLFEWLGAN